MSCEAEARFTLGFSEVKVPCQKEGAHLVHGAYDETKTPEGITVSVEYNWGINENFGQAESQV